ncbi:MAG: glycosyltransferase, partial [Planctomycetota bacterium]
PLRETLQAQINELNLAERINITGWTDNVWQHYRAADAFALTSHYEGFPGALLEAMAMGLPVVSVDCESGPRAMVEHEQNGLLIPPNDPDALVDAMQRVTESRSLRQRLGTAAVQVRQRFGWTRLVDAHLQVVYSLLNVT